MHTAVPNLNQYSTMSRHTLNFAPVTLKCGSDVLIGRQPYTAERLTALRAEFYATHVFHRDGKRDVILDIPVLAGQQPIGNVEERIDLTKRLDLWPALLSEALLRAFQEARDIIGTRPVAVLGSASRGLIQHGRLPSWIEKRTVQRFDVRSIHLTNNTRVVGLVCEIKTRNIIDANCAELLQREFPLLGRYVQINEPARDPRIARHRRLVGRVRAIQGASLVLDDHEDGYETVLAGDAFVEARKENFEACVRHLLGGDAASVLRSAEQKADTLHTGPGRKAQLEETLRYLQDKAHLEAVPGAKFGFAPLLSSDDKQFPFVEDLPKPFLVFDPSGTRKDDRNERGLKKNGPYDQRTFTPKSLRIAVICQAKHEGQVDRFVAKLLDGMPSTLTGLNKVARYGDGLLRRFQLSRPQVQFFTSSTASAADYASATRDALKLAADESFKWNLALVQVEEEFKRHAGSDNPYYATKALLLKRDIAVQSVRLETMGQPDEALVFSMNHMSLAVYAKLGGTPWLLAAKQTVAHELVIGLGSHTVTTARLGARQRYVGITTIFSSDGSYLLSDRTAVVPFEEYADALYETLKRSISTVRKQDNWRSTDKVRLVFHMFKPFKDAEAEAVQRTVGDLGLQNVTFAFLHVAPDHPYIIFDNQQAGIGSYGPKKGVLGPSRGLHIKMGDFQSLVVFSGASELKQASDGIPRPCLLKLHRLSTFTDMTYLARQAFEFSGHSWRMLAPEAFPITVRYSDLIAERLAGLEEVPDWDSDAIQFGQIGRTLWFL
jgi:hypothetical protein